MARSVRPLARLTSLSGTWRIVIWKCVESIGDNPYGGTPFIRHEYFRSPQVAESYLAKMTLEHPRNRYYMSDVYVLTTNEGDSGFVLRHAHEDTPRRTDRVS